MNDIDLFTRNNRISRKFDYVFIINLTLQNNKFNWVICLRHNLKNFSRPFIIKLAMHNKYYILVTYLILDYSGL